MANKRKSLVYKAVIFGRNCTLGNFVEIGTPPRSKKEGEYKTQLGDDCVIRTGTIVYAGAVLGNNCQTGHNVLIRENNSIGEGSSIGSYSELAPGNRIGKNCRIHSYCFLEKVTLEDNIVVAPGVIFSTDKYMNAHIGDPRVKGATVKTGAKIGARAVILPNIVIGKNALVGAGAVVTKDVKAGTIVAGCPARVIGTAGDSD